MQINGASVYLGSETVVQLRKLVAGLDELLPRNGSHRLNVSLAGNYEAARGSLPINPAEASEWRTFWLRQELAGPVSLNPVFTDLESKPSETSSGTIGIGEHLDSNGYLKPLEGGNASTYLTMVIPSALLPGALLDSTKISGLQSRENLYFHIDLHGFEGMLRLQPCILSLNGLELNRYRKVEVPPEKINLNMLELEIPPHRLNGFEQFQTPFFKNLLQLPDYLNPRA